jgi:tetratricopeptide (TPR) repeat protein
MKRAFLRVLGKDLPGALADYNQAVATAPKVADAYLNRAVTYRDLGDFQRAADDFSQALALGPPDVAAARCLRGDLRLRMKDYRGAIEDYDQAIALDANFGHAYIGRGMARLGAGDDAGAFQDLNYAIEGRAKLYRYDSLLRLMPQMRTLFPDSSRISRDSKEAPWTAYFGRGRLRLKKGDYERAFSDLKRAVGKNPDTVLYFGLAQIAIRHCGDGEDTLDRAAEGLGTTRAALVQAHREFVAKTPCAEDLLE